MSQFSEGDLEGVLGEALSAQRAVPGEWREAARAAYTWRSVDQELLELTYDSQRDTALALRGDEGGRTLEFACEGLSLEVELTGTRILGRLSAPVPGEVVLERPGGPRRTIPTDESGFFTLEGEDHGLVRFAVRTGAVERVTEWVAI